jgi:uncharacterized protein (TIGR02270 family)
VTAPAKLSYIPDLVEEHFDELQFLWGQRSRALRSPTARIRDVLALEERVEGHASGLLIIGERLLEFAEPALAGDEAMPAVAAAFALLRLGTRAGHQRVAAAFETARGPKLAALRDALAHGPSAPLDSRLAELFATAPPPVAAAAGEVLAFHSAITPAPQQMERLVRAEDADARATVWRLASYCGTPLPAAWYEAGLRDDDGAVQQAAMRAAAWNRSAAFGPYCRALTATPTPESVEPVVVLAAVAPSEEYQLVAAFATNGAAGPTRFRALGAFGHPYFIDLLIQEMDNPDPAAAAAAGVAFTKMTGRDVESDTHVKVSPDGKPPADDFEAEFMDDVFLPDPALARKYWQELVATLARAPRICRGLDVSQPLTPEQFATLDMESRWEYCLRARLFSGWQGTPLVLERYPQRL